MKRKGKSFWLARDGCRGCKYFVSDVMPAAIGTQWRVHVREKEVFYQRIDAETFEKVFGVVLDPGQGPFKMKAMKLKKNQPEVDFYREPARRKSKK
jgi:hypothetical protein